MGNKLQLTQGSVSALLRGDSTPSYELLQRMASMGYNMNWLVSGKGPMMVSDLGAYPDVPGDVLAIAEKLVRYPEIIESIRDVIETREKLETTKDELKAKLKYPKSKK